MSTHCYLEAHVRFFLIVTLDRTTDGSNISLYYSNILISMLPEHLVSCQAHKIG